MTAEPPQLPIGLVVPSDHQAARELIDECLAMAEQEQRSREFIEKIVEEKVLTFEV